MIRTSSPLLQTDVAERLPGESPRARPAAPILALKVLARALLLAVAHTLSAPLWLPYLVGVAVWGWPPHVVRLGQVRRYLRLLWTVRPAAPGLPLGIRAWLSLSVLQKIVITPYLGLAWFLDEVLYGHALDATPVTAPLLEISAGRSGSTQLARYLEADPHLVAPSFLQASFPYLWLWRLAPHTLGRLLSKDQVRQKFETILPPDFLERHEGDPFLTDTFDAPFYLAHLNHLSPLIAPEVMEADFGFGVIAPHNRALWEETFVALLDRVARKTLLHAPPAPDGAPPRFFVKGHFLCAADALERRFPDARFLTIVREPAPRIRSAVNYLHANPLDEAVGPAPWAWLAAAVTRSEITYCEREQVWFSQIDGPRRCVVRFEDYVADLPGVMAEVYRTCLDTPALPDHVPTAHPPRERTHYQVNRTLEQVGIDEVALNERLASYALWRRASAEQLLAETL